MTAWRDVFATGSRWPSLSEPREPTPPTRAELRDAAGQFIARGVGAGPGSPAYDVLDLTDREEEIDR